MYEICKKNEEIKDWENEWMRERKRQRNKQNENEKKFKIIPFSFSG